MKIHCLGTAGYHPSETRHTSGYYVEEVGLLLDAGSGTFRMLPLLKDRTELDIVLSHAHLDHVFGLSFLLGIRLSSNLRHIRVHGQSQKLETIRTHLFDQDLFPISPEFEWMSIDDSIEPNKLATTIEREQGRVASPPSPLTIAGADVRCVSLPHPGGSIGYRFDWPEASLAYITDTTADLQQAYVHTIRDVDLLLHECNFADKHAKFAIDTGHSNTTPVLEVFRASRARKLLISHLSPYSDDPDSIDLANAILSFPDIPQETVTIAEDRMQIEFGT